MKKRSKKIVFLSLLLILLTGTAFSDSFQTTINVLLNSVKINVDGQEIKTPNLLYNGTTYVPLREISEALDKEVVWDNNTKTVNIVSKHPEDVIVNSDSNDQLSNNKNSNYPYALSYKDIEEAFNIGQTNQPYLGQSIAKYELKPNSSKHSRNIKISFIVTPFNLIIRDKAVSVKHNREYTMQDAIELHDSMVDSEGLIFIVNVLGDTSNPHQETSIFLRQDNKIIQPFSIGGLDKAAKHTNSYPPYEAELIARFSNTYSDIKIDFSKPAELVVVLSSKDEVTYDIDFSKYK